MMREEIILVVDDHKPLKDVIQGMLEVEDYTVFTAPDGRQGLEMMEQVHPDLIVSDIMLPIMNGFEFCKTVRARPEWANIPFIFLTARTEKEDILRGIRAGADDYLSKPFVPQKLVDAVASKLRRSRIIDEYLRGAKYDDQLPPTEPDHLTGGIAHDMHGGLDVIHHVVRFLGGDLADTVYASNPVKISRSLNLCDLVLRNLGKLGGRAIFQPDWVNIETVVRDVMLVLEYKLVEVKPVIDIAPDTPQILSDEGQMKQVFMNLIANAGEAMPDGGTLTVRTQRKEQMLCIEVSDTGCGILPEDQNKVFYESFTTKNQGYGFGLTIVRTIITHHGGTIEMESEVGKGTTFTLHLPTKPK